MTRQEYIAQLRAGLRGLPDSAAADIVSDYEEYFAEGISVGRREEDIARGLGDPRKLAAELGAVTRLETFQEHGGVRNFARLFFAALVMLGFNLVLLVPALLCIGVLSIVSLGALAVYLLGIVIVAGSLPGVPHSLGLPMIGDGGLATAGAGIGLILGATGIMLVCLAAASYVITGFIRTARKSIAQIKSSNT